VSTDGASPALARWLRDRLADDCVGPEYGVLADLLAERRDEIHADGRSTEGVDWRAALDSDMLELVRAGRVDQARERIQECLS
jgi:precorrin-2 dehydrogenase / sirohydrochlorin ferrochelatase